VRGVVGQVTEEGAVAVLLDELEGTGREVIDDEAISANDLAVVLEWRAEIASPGSSRSSPVETPLTPPRWW